MTFARDAARRSGAIQLPEAPMATLAPSSTAVCCNGRHRPRRVPVRAGADRTICLDCGCTLVRTLATRQWIYSGKLA
jgi:hypothetical protein